MNIIILSKKGFDFKGNKLSEESLHSGVKVYCDGNLYITGNRYHDLVELYFCGKLYKYVSMKNISLVKNKQMKTRKTTYDYTTMNTFYKNKRVKRFSTISTYLKNNNGMRILDLKPERIDIEIEFYDGENDDKDRP